MFLKLLYCFHKYLFTIGFSISDKRFFPRPTNVFNKDVMEPLGMIVLIHARLTVKTGGVTPLLATVLAVSQDTRAQYVTRVLLN